jgi:hypothetical protein
MLCKLSYHLTSPVHIPMVNNIPLSFLLHLWYCSHQAAARQTIGRQGLHYLHEQSPFQRGVSNPSCGRSKKLSYKRGKIFTCSDIFLKISSTPKLSLALVSKRVASTRLANPSARERDTTLSDSKSDFVHAIAIINCSEGT